MVGGVPQKDPRQGQSYSMASSRSGGGAAGVLRRALVALCAASIMGGDRAAAAVQCVGAPCVLGEYSGVSRARNDTLLSAVGCEQEFHVSFGTAFRDTANIEVSMCARSATGVCVNKLNSIVSIDQELIDCCSMAIQDRTCRGLSELVADLPLEIFKCAYLEVVKSPGMSTAIVRFVTPYFADLSNADFYKNQAGYMGRHEICVFGMETDSFNNTVQGSPHCVQIQVQSCSACLKGGAGLSTLSKAYGTHWTQIYSSNQDIKGSPDKLEQGRLVRLGPMYRVQAGDTAMSIALKLGITVNQIFFWNKQLVLTQDPIGSMAEGTMLCVLPKTCYNSFGKDQVVFNQREIYTPIEGGAWSDPFQIDPNIYVRADPRKGPDAIPAP